MSEMAAGPFEAHFGRPPSSRYFAPGRLNLIGEHTDYNDGLVLPVAVHLGTYFDVSPNEGALIRVHSILTNATAEIQLATVSDLEPRGDWTDYFTGVIRQFMSPPGVDAGLDILVESTLPIGSGLSSSASIATGMAAVLNQEWSGDRSRLELAQIARRAENDFVGLACGILDQVAVALSEKSRAILLDCGSLERSYLPFPDNDYSLLAFESAVPRKLVDSGYNQRRAECERALSLLQGEYGASSLSDLGPDDIDASAALREDPVAYRRARHVVTENARVLDAADALRQGDMGRFGVAMYASHESLSKDYDVSCDELDTIVELARNEPGVVGAKMTGAGFGGSVVVLVANDAAHSASDSMSSAYRVATGLEPTVTPCRLSSGVHKLGGQ